MSETRPIVPLFAPNSTAFGTCSVAGDAGREIWGRLQRQAWQRLPCSKSTAFGTSTTQRSPVRPFESVPSDAVRGARKVARDASASAAMPVPVAGDAGCEIWGHVIALPARRCRYRGPAACTRGRTTAPHAASSAPTAVRCAAREGPSRGSRGARRRRRAPERERCGVGHAGGEVWGRFGDCLGREKRGSKDEGGGVRLRSVGSEVWGQAEAQRRG